MSENLGSLNKFSKEKSLCLIAWTYIFLLYDVLKSLRF